MRIVSIMLWARIAVDAECVWERVLGLETGKAAGSIFLSLLIVSYR